MYAINEFGSAKRNLCSVILQKTEKLKSFKNNAIYVKEPNYGETEEFQKRKVPSLYSSLLVISTGEAGGNKYKSYSRKPEKERERSKQTKKNVNK